VNNVGGRRENVAVEEQALADWQRLLDLNLTSAFLCTKRIGGAMLPRRWGRIINVASICGQVATRGIHGRHYETAKAALVGFTRAVAADWAPYGVTVNAIAPGGFMTDANRRWFAERPEFRKEIEALIPMARLGEPGGSGPRAVFLPRGASPLLAGAVVPLDGRYTLWLAAFLFQALEGDVALQEALVVHVSAGERAGVLPAVLRQLVQLLRHVFVGLGVLDAGSELHDLVLPRGARHFRVGLPLDFRLPEQRRQQRSEDQPDQQRRQQLLFH